MSEEDYRELSGRIVEINALEKTIEVHKKEVSRILRKSNYEYALQKLSLMLHPHQPPDIKSAIEQIENQLKNLE